MLLRGARDGLLTVFTLHESGNPQTHHLLSVSSTLDELGYMYFHLVTMVDMSEVPAGRVTLSPTASLAWI